MTFGRVPCHDTRMLAQSTALAARRARFATSRDASMHKHLLTPIALAVGAALAVSGCSNNQNQNTSAPAASASAPAPAHTASAPAPGSTVAIAPEQSIAFDLDDQYNACNDFANYVNAKWNKANPIPADQTTWGAFGILHERSLQQQKQILEKAAQDAKDHKGSELGQKLGNLYAAGLDTAPVDIADFINTSYDNGDSYVFNFGSSADFKDATRQIGYVFQDGLGLPTRDYYLSPQYKGIRDAYVKYIAKSLELVGTPQADAKKQADEVMKFETELAK